jgi:hypothetical protein
MTASGESRARVPKDERIASLSRIVENMATQHVIMYDHQGHEMHPDWCPLCRLEKAEEIGSPAAIAEWVEQTVIPMLGVKMHLPERSVARGAVHQGCSAGDLLNAIRESEVLLGGPESGSRAER